MKHRATWWNVVTLAVALSLAGCWGARTIMMQDPKTGQVFECGTAGNDPWARATSARVCSESLERRGWVKIGAEGE